MDVAFDDQDYTSDWLRCGRVVAAVTTRCWLQLPPAGRDALPRHLAVELPRQTLPAPQAFITATLGSMGWGLNPESLFAPYLADGTLVELVPDSSIDVPLHWQHARSASSLVEGLSRQIVGAASRALVQPKEVKPQRNVTACVTANKTAHAVTTNP